MFVAVRYDGVRTVAVGTAACDDGIHHADDRLCHDDRRDNVDRAIRSTAGIARCGTARFAHVVAVFTRVDV